MARELDQKAESIIEWDFLLDLLREAEKRLLRQAKNLYLEAQELLDEHYGSYHPKNVYFLDQAVYICQRLGESDESTRYQEKAQEIRECSRHQTEL